MTKEKPKHDFLKELNAKISLNEGIEGHRAILRAIYRTGHISLQDLAYDTLLPIPVLSKVVNFLIEKDILGRIPEGILYTEQGMKYIEQELGLKGYGVQPCEVCEGFPVYISPRWEPVLDYITPILEQRPEVNTTLDQAFADPETSLIRALYLYNEGALEGKDIALLGDDDFTSVAIASLFLGVYPNDPFFIPQSMTIFDIDERLLTQIKNIQAFHSFPISTMKWDYRLAIPQNALHQFDTILVDPPYSINGLKLVLSRAISLLREEPGAEVYLSYAHRSPQELFEIQKIILEMGFVLLEIHPRFNYYEGGQILGNTTQLMRLTTTSMMTSFVSHAETYQEAIYTGEVNPKIKIYYCTNCQRVIALGKSFQFETIEQLKKNGCPYCQSRGPFELDEKLDDISDDSSVDRSVNRSDI